MHPDEYFNAHLWIGQVMGCWFRRFSTWGMSCQIVGKKGAADSIGPEKDLTDHKVTAGRAL